MEIYKTNDQQANKKGWAVVSQMSQQEFRLDSYNPQSEDWNILNNAKINTIQHSCNKYIKGLKWNKDVQKNLDSVEAEHSKALASQAQQTVKIFNTG